MSTLPKNANDIAGKKFEMLTAIKYSHSENGAVWLFRCDCGCDKLIRSSMVTKCHIKSCGCLSREAMFTGATINPGDKFGRITAVKTAGKSGHNIKWECKCSCGTMLMALASNLTSGNTKSCGCHRISVSTEKAWVHGMSDTAAYRLWKNVMRRCYETANPAFVNYGGRGIAVCDRWHNFENFYSDMGDRPKGRSLDRINNDLGYSPENCRWATREDQANNTRRNSSVTIGNKTQTISQWSAELGLPASRAFARKKLGWKDDELFLPKRPSR